jgi:uncharacterized protein
MGRIFCAVVDDTFGWHETIAGNTTKAIVARKWGEQSYQAARNDWQQNGHDSFLVEAAKYGMGRRDLAANVNWFSKVVVANDGSMSLDIGAARAGARIELRFEMDTLVLLHTCPHPFNPANSYPRKAGRFEIFEGPPAADDDPARLKRPENARGFENNRIFLAGCEETHR